MSDDFANYEKEFLNNIKRDKSQNISFFGSSLLNDVHKKVLNKTFRINDDATKKSSNKPSTNPTNNKAQMVVNSDVAVRKAVQDLYISLKGLGDKDIAKKLIFDHIMMLNEIFKEFEE